MHRYLVHAHVGQDVRHHQRMHHVRFAGIPRLPFVTLAREAKGPFEAGQIVLGPVLADLSFQLPVEMFHRIGRRLRGQTFGKTRGL